MAAEVDTLAAVAMPASAEATAAADMQVASPVEALASTPTADRSPVRLLHAPLLARLPTRGRSLVRRFPRTGSAAPALALTASAIIATDTPVAATARTTLGLTAITIPTGCGIPARPITTTTAMAMTRMPPPPPK